MINTTIFKSAFIFLIVMSSGMSKPLETEKNPEDDVQPQPQSSKPTTEVTPSGDHYDQRQNGTKNFRLNIDGVVFFVAPSEALLLAGELDPSNLASLGLADALRTGNVKSKNYKPEIDDEAGEKQIRQKSAHSHGFRLSNLLGPILRQISS